MTVKIGIVGYGYWGSKVTRVFHSSKESEVIGICDKDDLRVGSAQTDFPQVPVFVSYRQLLNSTIDAIYIATPLSTHFEIALEALEQGKDVLVEKPMVSNSAQARVLVSLARENGRILMVGHTFVYDPAIRALRRLIGHQEVGQILCVDSARTGLGRFRRDANAIWDLAAHDIAILRYVTNQEPIEVRVWGENFFASQTTGLAYLNFRFTNGITGFVHVSWLHVIRQRQWNVIGKDGIISLSGVGKRAILNTVWVKSEDELVSRRSNPFQSSLVRRWMIHQVEPLLLECGHFIHCIQRRQQPLTSGYDGLRVVQILEATNESLMAGGSIVPIPRLVV